MTPTCGSRPQWRHRLLQWDKIIPIREGYEWEVCVAIGNAIRNAEVSKAMIKAFEYDPSAHLAEWLV